MKFADLKQQKDENIINFIKRVKIIATKFLRKEFSIKMATITDMGEPSHQY